MQQIVPKVVLGIPEKNNSMKYLITAFLFHLTVSCHTAKKAVRPAPVTDSLQAELPATVDSVVLDSDRVAEFTFSEIRKNRLDFQTFSARVKLNYVAAEKSLNDVNAFLRIKKDSVIWVSLNAALGIEAIRLLITPDTVKVLDKLNKTIQYRDFRFLQEATRLPVDFSALQDLLIGNPVFLDSNMRSFSRSEGRILLETLGNVFLNNSEFTQQPLLVQQTHLQRTDTTVRQFAHLEYLEYALMLGRYFSNRRKVAVREKKDLAIELEFRQVAFNLPISFPFAVPSNYKLK
jgi:hypothetical protein